MLRRALSPPLSTQRLTPNLALAALILGAIGIGFAPVLAKLAVNAHGAATGRHLSPVAVAFWRLILAAPFFWLFFRWRKTRQPPTASRIGKGHFWILGLPGLVFAIDLGIWHWSFEYTTVANATLEANFAIILVPLASFIWLRERFNWLFVVGALTALFGMARLVGFNVSSSGDAWFGDVLGLTTAFAYAAYILTSKIALRHFSALEVMVWSTTGCAFFLFFGALVTPGDFLPGSLEAWGYVVALAAVAQGIGQGLIILGLSRLSAGFSSVTLIIQPVAATYLGWIWLGQVVKPEQAGAGLVVLAGIGLARIGVGSMSAK